ncbi:MAG: hypothetical protein ACFFAS_18160 [Promethearchaeota archaeon]
MMRHNYKSHGKHCYLRSFKTNCQKCGADVLYWECIHGCKIYFNYPPYGKLVKHYCRKFLEKSHPNKYKLIVKKPLGIKQEQSPRCPVCRKLFKNDNNLKEHFKQLVKIDEWHKLFSNSIHKNKEEKEDYDEEKKPIFGRINLKNKAK